jgi:hypothetical protein
MTRSPRQAAIPIIEEITINRASDTLSLVRGVLFMRSTVPDYFGAGSFYHFSQPFARSGTAKSAKPAGKQRGAFGPAAVAELTPNSHSRDVSGACAKMLAAAAECAD